MSKIGLVVTILSIIFGVTSISGLVASYENIAQREQHWNNIFDERLFQLDTLLSSFVDICKSDSTIKDDCNSEFTEIWDRTCNRDADWDVIDSCKRVQGFLITN